ncbi:hypothetical protein B0H10DRAFT_407293 [Mycena sp. CBHHK59/15]|nr:hypothetical protein B0H10DRAFT_407293 [Mycena sp. CBHHK59/15]
MKYVRSADNYSTTPSPTRTNSARTAASPPPLNRRRHDAIAHTRTNSARTAASPPLKRRRHASTAGARRPSLASLSTPRASRPRPPHAATRARRPLRILHATAAAPAMRMDHHISRFDVPSAARSTRTKPRVRRAHQAPLASAPPTGARACRSHFCGSPVRAQTPHGRAPGTAVGAHALDGLVHADGGWPTSAAPHACVQSPTHSGRREQRRRLLRR